MNPREGRALRVRCALEQRFSRGGDSTLSACIRSVIASDVGYADVALDDFLDACAVDLVDLHGNTADGIHIASCGGTWLALVAGFGGLGDSDGEVSFHPRLPAEWDRLRFRVQICGQLIAVDMTRATTTYQLLAGDGLLIRHACEELRVDPGAPVARPAPPVGAARERTREIADSTSGRLPQAA